MAAAVTATACTRPNRQLDHTLGVDSRLDSARDGIGAGIRFGVRPAAAAEASAGRSMY